MQIDTRHPILPFDLRDSAPAGVTVFFEPPTQTREFNPEYVPVIYITLRFAAEIDVNAVVAWLIAKLTPDRSAEAHYERTKIKIEVGPLKAAIDREIYSHPANRPSNKPKTDA